MYITVYRDPEDNVLHCWVRETQPAVPPDYLEHCDIVVFDTTVSYADENHPITRGDILRTAGESASLVDDDANVVNLNTGMDENFGKHLAPMFSSYQL